MKIRLGGSLQDKVIYDVGQLEQPCLPFVKNDSMMFGFSDGCLPMSRWDALNAFFNKTGAVVAFGLNELNGKRLMSDGTTEGAWNSSNARDFIQYTVDHGYKIKAWELGNELSGRGIRTNVSVQQYAADVIELHGILDEIYQDYEEKPLLVAPDGSSFVADWFKEFLQLTGLNIVNVVTHHFYNLGAGNDTDLVEKILNPSYLSQEAATFKGLQDVLQNYGSWSNAWVGESGGAYNSGQNLVTNAFVMSFWYLHELGMAAVFNTKSFCRQSLIGGNYGILNTTTFVPNPDYYSALLWHRLMGTHVLATNSTGTEYLSAYAHSTKNATGITLLLINFSKDTSISVQVSTGSGTYTDGNSRLEYHLTAKDGNIQSQTMLLNGNILEITPDGEIPSLPPVKVPTNGSINVDPLSIAFVQLPYVQFTACS